MSETSLPEMNVLLTAEQIAHRVEELARQISEKYSGQTLHVVCILDNAFLFMADLVRYMEVPVICGFVKPRFKESSTQTGTHMEIFFSPEIDVRGQQVLLVESVVQTGITAEFLMRNIAARGAASVRLVTLLDKPAARRVSLQPDFFGFLVEQDYVVGYGLAGPDQTGRNLPYVAALTPQRAKGGAEGESAQPAGAKQ